MLFTCKCFKCCGWYVHVGTAGQEHLQFFVTLSHCDDFTWQYTVTNSISSPLENIHKNYRVTVNAHPVLCDASQNNEPMQHKHCSTFIWCVSASPDYQHTEHSCVMCLLIWEMALQRAAVLCGSWQLLHFSCSASAVYPVCLYLRSRNKLGQPSSQWTMSPLVSTPVSCIRHPIVTVSLLDWSQVDYCHPL